MNKLYVALMVIPLLGGAIFMASPSTFENTTAVQDADKKVQEQLDAMAEKEIISKLRQCDTTLFNEMDRMSKCPSGFSWGIHHEKAQTLDAEYQGYFANYVGCMEDMRGTFKINHSTGSVMMMMQSTGFDLGDEPKTEEKHEWMTRDAWFAKYYPKCTACSSEVPPMKQKPEKMKEKKIK